MLEFIILFLCAHHVFGVQTFYTATDANTFGDFALGAGFDINRFEPKASHVFKESNDDLLYDIMPVTSTKTRCAMITRTKDMTDNLHVHGALSVSYKMISGSGHVTFDQKKETMNRVAYYTCTVDRTLFTISVNTPDITDDWSETAGNVISNNLIDLDVDQLQKQVGDYHIKSITYGRRYTTEIQMVYTSDDAFEMIEGKLKAEIGMGALSVTAEVEIEKSSTSFKEDLTLKVSSEALGFIEEQPLFLPSDQRNEDGEVTVTAQEQIEEMVQRNLAAFNRVDEQGGVTAKTKLSKEMLFAELGDAYPLWYAVDSNYPYFKDTLTALSPFQEEDMLRHLDQAYDILRELQEMQENIENRADMLFDSYHLLSGATDLSIQFLNYRQQLMERILIYRTEVNDYLKQKPIDLAERDVYIWALEESRLLTHISIDMLHTDVWDLLGMEDVEMNDHNPIGATCLFNGIQATMDGERKKFAGRVVFGSLTVRHVLFDVDGKVVSLGYIDHEHDNRKNNTWIGTPHELVFVREDCTLLREGSDVWYEDARYTIASIGSDEHLTPRGYVNKDKLTNIRLQLTPQDTTRDIEVVITREEVYGVDLRGYENSNGFTLDDDGRLMFQNGYVCDKNFRGQEARMICTQLGYADLQNVVTGISIPATNAWGRPRITMFNLHCQENSMKLEAPDCSYSTNLDDIEWDSCGINHGVQLKCTNERKMHSDEAKMKISSDNENECVRDQSALGHIINTADSCLGGDGDSANHLGNVKSVEVTGDVCVKFYRGTVLRCVISQGKHDFTQQASLERFCYQDDALDFKWDTPNTHGFPEEILMIDSKRSRLEGCHDQDSLLEEDPIEIQDQNETITIRDCKTGADLGLCDTDDDFNQACQLTCEECEINPRNHFQVKIIAATKSFAKDCAGNSIPIEVRSSDGASASFIQISEPTGPDGEVFEADYECGTRLHLNAYPINSLDHENVECEMSVIEPIEARITEDGQVIVSGDLEATVSCKYLPRESTSCPPELLPSMSPTGPRATTETFGIMQTDQWGYESEDFTEYEAVLFSAENIEKLKAHPNEYGIFCDLTFSFKRDDSTSDGYFRYLDLASLTEVTQTFTGPRVDYQLFTLNRCNQLACAGIECPWTSKDAILLEVNFKPREGTADDNLWSRNQYTMMGTYYYASRACSPSATSMTKLSTDLSSSVYACEGTWTEPGVQAGAARLCGDGWSLCGHDEMLVVESATCDNIPGFYASQVSSNGYRHCQRDNSGTNDIWGCGNTCSLTSACGSMRCIIGAELGVDIDNWELTTSTNSEKTQAYATGSNAGVLCCASHERAPEACTSISGARWRGNEDAEGCFWHGTGYTESQCMSLCSTDTKVANCHVWLWAINGSCRHWARCAGHGDSDYEANQDGWVGGICPAAAFEYEMIPDHIGCQVAANNFGYLGRPSDFVDGVAAECRYPTDKCVALGRRTCNALQSCWGFAYNSRWGVQLYSSHAANSNECTGTLGLQQNNDWTVYRKYQLAL